MRKLFITLLLLLPPLCRAQYNFHVFTEQDITKGIPCDKVHFRLAYEMSFVRDTLQTPYRMEKETMILEIGHSVTQFYSYPAYHQDSVFGDDMAKKASQATINEHLSAGSSGKIFWKLYMNYPQKGLSSYLDAISTERYCCVEKMEQPQWNICPDSTATILGYACRLATTYYKGRKWYAYYADEIPLHEGPWKLRALPGLVLRAYDAKRQFIFEATGMQQIKTDQDLYYKGEKFEPISKQALNKLFARFYADPIGFMTTNPNVKVRIHDDKGNAIAAPKNIPNNPLER